MTNRERFEQHAEAEGLDLTRDGDDYDSNETNDVYRGWQAALASDTRRSVENARDVLACLRDFARQDIEQGDTDSATRTAKIIDAIMYMVGDELPPDEAAMYRDVAAEGRKLRENAAT